MPALLAPAPVFPKAAYNTLLTQIRKTIQLGRARIEREKIRTNWRVGHYLHCFILKERKRAPLGKKLIPNLARDLKVSRTSLYNSLEFYRAYPVVSIVETTRLESLSSTSSGGKP